MNIKKTANDLHHEVEAARESGDAQLALEAAMRALLGYAQEENSHGFAELLDSIYLTLKNLHRRDQFDPYWVLAGALVKASLEIAEQSGIKKSLAIPQFNFAQYLEESGKLAEAKEMYEKSIASMESNPPKEHDRPAVLNQMKLHLSLCELFLNNNLDQVKEIEGLLEELSLDGGVDADFNCKVWISGGYLKLARYFKDRDRDVALTYLKQAREIIEADERLVLRRDHLNKMLDAFK